MSSDPFNYGSAPSGLYCDKCGFTTAKCLRSGCLRIDKVGANDKQIGGDHYDKTGEQHWDRQFRMYGPGYFVGCATKYIERYKGKNGKQDLEKAVHFLQKLIELEYPEPLMDDGDATSQYVNQDM